MENQPLEDVSAMFVFRGVDDRTRLHLLFNITSDTELGPCSAITILDHVVEASTQLQISQHHRESRFFLKGIQPVSLREFKGPPPNASK